MRRLSHRRRALARRRLLRRRLVTLVRRIEHEDVVLLKAARTVERRIVQLRQAVPDARLPMTPLDLGQRPEPKPFCFAISTPNCFMSAAVSSGPDTSLRSTSTSPSRLPFSACAASASSSSSAVISPSSTSSSPSRLEGMRAASTNEHIGSAAHALSGDRNARARHGRAVTLARRGPRVPDAPRSDRQRRRSCGSRSSGPSSAARCSRSSST